MAVLSLLSFKPSNCLSVLLCAVLASAQHGSDEIPYNEHTVQHPYSTNGFDIAHWDFQGDTSLSDKYIRLTPDRQSRRGVLWNSVGFSPNVDGPVAPFEIEMRFHVHGQGKKLFGDGFAVWFTKDVMKIGSVFGSEDGFVGMGVLFDTYSNLNQGRQQYISVVIGDGKQHYDHDRDGGDIKLAGCEYDFRGKVMDARIVYDGDLLRMYLAEPDAPWEECFIVRKVRLPKNYHFGVSAATGDLADNHDIISFKVMDPVPMTDDERKDIEARINQDIQLGVEEEEHHDPQYEHPSGQPAGTELPLWVTVSMIVAIFVLAGLVYFVTQRQKEHRHKHFT